MNDPQTHPLTDSLHSLMQQRHTTALMIVPLLVRGSVIGTVGLDSDEPHRTFSASEQELAETLVAPISAAIDNNQLLVDVRRRADQLAAAAQISRAAISILDPNELMVRAADLIRERFDLYYAAIFILDEANQWANLRYATGEAGQRLMGVGHRLAVGSQSMVGTAIATQKARIALDVGQEAVRFNNPYLPDTHSEMALPLVVGGRAIGALDVQSTQYSAFTQEDITVLQTLADQLAIALENGRLFGQTQQRAHSEQLLNRVSNKLRSALEADSIMKITMTELQSALGARRIVARLGPAAVPTSAPYLKQTGPLSERSIPLPKSNSHSPSNGNGHSASSNGNGSL